MPFLAHIGASAVDFHAAVRVGSLLVEDCAAEHLIPAAAPDAAEHLGKARVSVGPPVLAEGGVGPAHHLCGLRAVVSQTDRALLGPAADSLHGLEDGARVGLLRPAEHSAEPIRLQLLCEDAGKVFRAKVIVDCKVPAPAQQMGAQRRVLIVGVNLLEHPEAVPRIGEAVQAQNLVDVQKHKGERGVAEAALTQPGPPAEIALQNVLWQIPVGRIVGPEDAAVNRVALPVNVSPCVLGKKG